MKSMTGFASTSFSLEKLSFRLEIRSVNNRFLDVKIRLPWTSGELERLVDSAVRTRISRGRLELSVWEESFVGAAVDVRLNEPLAIELGQALKQLANLIGTDMKTAASMICPMRELLQTTSAPKDITRIWSVLEPSLNSAVDGLISMRQKEGRALAKDIKGNLDEMVSHVDKIRGLKEGEVERYRQKLLDRLKDLQQGSLELDSVRIAQEVALIAERCDINEELTRLDSHSQQLREMLNSNENAIGRKIDFLLQEINRELTTVASKTISADIAHCVVEAKACVEKMREQGQNVE